MEPFDTTAPDVPAGARPLFVAGAPRSGTTGLAKYLNRHPEILVCRERYKYLAPKKITPDLFSFERLLHYGERETNQSREAHVKLLAAKDPSRLRWVGDKYPHYVKGLGVLARNNPGAHFLILYRPVIEVAESFQARASNPRDRWPAENGFAAGIELWNKSLQLTRRFIEGTRDANVLIVDYHRFFYEPEGFIPLLSDFLELEFDARIRRVWASMSERFGEGRRAKQAPTAEQSALVEERKDAETDAWIRDYVARQGEGLGPPPGRLLARTRAALTGRAGVGSRRR